jgi:hypothetical protein
VPKTPARQRPASRQDARTRYRAAQAYLEVADLVLGEQSRDEYLNVAAGLAVLAGIAASDAICASRLGLIHRGEDHQAASALLAESTTDGTRLAILFRRLIDVKGEAHYGVIVVAPTKARAAVRDARRLVERAGEEVER